MFGYTGKMLRVELEKGDISIEDTSEELAEKYVGGTGFGAKYLYDEVEPGTRWDDPGNCLIIAPGPTAGTKIAGSAGISIISKGPMTNLAGASQANGYFGAFLKFSGFDAIIIKGRSPQLVYLTIMDGRAELRDASFIQGKDCNEAQDRIKEMHGNPKKYSVLSIGPAGESLVRFAVINGDKGHIASKNGLGAVMGAKNLKAIVVHYGNTRIDVKDSQQLGQLKKALFEDAKKADPLLSKWGTMGGFNEFSSLGQIPVRNYTTSVVSRAQELSDEFIRTHYDVKPNPCWACGMKHCHTVKVTQGRYKGQQGEEPEFECVNAWGPLIGNQDMGAIVMLTDLVDRLGLDVNEAGWLIAWAMECYEKGIITREQLDGIDLRWGNVEAVKQILTKICRREGVGNLLAEGVKRASEAIGGEAPSIGIYTMKGATPRSHDHRSRWHELFDTCVSSTSTLEISGGLSLPIKHFGGSQAGHSFSHSEVSTACARINGWFLFIDSLVLCRFCAVDPKLTAATVNTVTGWDLDNEKILAIGKRIANQLRMFNLLHGLDISTEKPSPRYGSTPVDGPHQGKGIMKNWSLMVENYYHEMGWHRKNGRPLAQTLRTLGLEDLVQDLDKI